MIERTLPFRVPACAPFVLIVIAAMFFVAPATAQHVRHEAGSNVFDYFDGLEYAENVPSPEQFFGYRIGERFTLHHQLVEYLTAVADASDRVEIEQYGETHEGRSLHLVTISSPANLSRIDEIFAANRRLADPRSISDEDARAIINNNPAISWFSYNVHGNEASGSEAAMQVVYTLAAATNPEVERILNDTVVVIDPMLNPDGRDRYVNWYKQTRGHDYDASPDAAEHYEPWPGGRTNHYLFDLNRDWIWLVHPESKSRLVAYRRVLPHLHIDYHEQGWLNPFFLGAGDTPYNLNIPDESKEWVEKYGEANAAAFDARSLIYSTKERFDYLYPGYGKVLPVYHGAVGMLAEKAGHGFAGLAVEIDDQNTLTLVERARDHYVLSMSNAETTAANRQAQLERFYRFFKDSIEYEKGKPKAYIISSESDPTRLHKAFDFARSHGIELHRTESALRAGESLRLHEYGKGKAEEAGTTIPPGSWIIHSNQPMAHLMHAMFERSTEIEDPDTYDITGWSLPVAFGLDAWFTMDEAPSGVPLETFELPAAEQSGEGSVAILVDSRQHDFPQAVGLAVRHEIFARATGEEIEIDGRSFGAGSLLIHRIRNSDRDLDAFVRELLDAGIAAHFTNSGLSSAGPALGANANDQLTAPKVLLVRGEPTSSYSYGQHWHLLDIEMPFPHSSVNADRIGSVDLDEYTVIVLPDGGGLSEIDTLRDWIRGGGALVASGSAARWASRALLELEEKDLDENLDEDDRERPKASELTYEEREARGVEDRIPGSILRIALDRSHPLTAGIETDWLGVLKRGDGVLPVSDSGYVVARIDDEPLISGVLSDRNARRLSGEPFMTHHRLGRGNVILFSDDLTIRGFQHAPVRLLMNAIMYGASL
ncbi:MAG: M14 family zinc carboxypeptidase [Phycisphaerales bacterium]